MELNEQKSARGNEKSQAMEANIFEFIFQKLKNERKRSLKQKTIMQKFLVEIGNEN